MVAAIIVLCSVGLQGPIPFMSTYPINVFYEILSSAEINNFELADVQFIVVFQKPFM
jgi:hypothetical protein